MQTKNANKQSPAKGTRTDERMIEMRMHMHQLMYECFMKICRNIDSLSPDDRLAFYMAILGYAQRARKSGKRTSPSLSRN